MNYREVLEQAQTRLAKAREYSRLVDDTLYKAKKAESKFAAEVQIIKNIAVFAQIRAKNKEYSYGVWEWKVEKTAEKEFFRLKTANKHFILSLCERTDLKRFKWCVALQGTEVIYDMRSNFCDDEYLARKYNTKPMDKKFKSEEDARKYIKEMQELILKDHKEEIDYQVALASTIKEADGDE